MEIMTVTVITVCAADRQHIYSSPKAIPHPLNPLNLHAQRACPCLPADWYLSPIVSNAACTEILRLRLRMTVPGGKSRNADFILIAGGDTTTLSGQRPLSNFRTLRPFGAEPRQPSSLNPGRQGAFIIHHRHRALQRYCPEGCTHFPCRTLSARTSG